MQAGQNRLRPCSKQISPYRRLLLILMILVSGTSWQETAAKGKTIPNGLYLIDRIDTVAGQPEALSRGEMPVYFSKLFEEFNSDSEYLRLIIDTTRYVPLELRQEPVAEQQTEAKKKLLLSLSKAASERLKTFTTTYLMRRVALVVHGEVFTMHQIKAPITSGQLQITRCNDNACERIYVELRHSVKRRR